jgi:hypothetical protein
MSIEKEVKTKDIENIFKKIIAENFSEGECHLGIEGFVDSKWTRPEKDLSTSYYSQNIRKTE